MFLFSSLISVREESRGFTKGMIFVALRASSVVKMLFLSVSCWHLPFTKSYLSSSNVVTAPFRQGWEISQLRGFQI